MQTPSRSRARSRASRTAWPSESKSWSRTSVTQSTTCDGSSRRLAASATTSRVSDETVQAPLRAHPVLQAQVRVLRLQRLRAHGFPDARLRRRFGARAGAGARTAPVRGARDGLFRRRHPEPLAAALDDAAPLFHPLQL